MNIETLKQNIKLDEIYNISQMREIKVFWWTNSHRSYRRIIQRDRNGENLLKSEVSGSDTKKEYKIKGRNIIKFLMRYGEGLAMQSRSHIE